MLFVGIVIFNSLSIYKNWNKNTDIAYVFISNFLDPI